MSRFLFILILSLIASSSIAAPFPEYVAEWTDATKAKQRQAGRDLLQSIKQRIAAGERQIVVEKGDYRFDELSEGRYPAHITWIGLKDVTLDFQGSTFWFENPRTGLKLRDCVNVKLENLKLDWDPLPYIQGRIVSIDEQAGTFEFEPEAGYLESAYHGITEAGRRRAFAFDGPNGDFKDNQVGCTVGFKESVPNERGLFTLKYFGFYEIPLQDSGFEVGDPLVILDRMGRAIRLENLSHCKLEDMTLYSSPFVAISSWAGEGATFRRVKIIPRPGTSRLMGGNADGINCTNMAYGPLIEDCEIRNLGDDFVNVHASLARVVAQEAPNQIITSILANRENLEGPITLEFFERSTMKRLEVRTVVHAEHVAEWPLREGETLADLSHRWYSGDAASLQYGKTVEVHRLTLDEAVKIEGDVVAVCPDFTSRNAIIRNNVFRGSPSRGIRHQTPNVLIENNHVSYTGNAGLSCLGQPTYWGEGPYVYNARIKNNTFRNVATSPSSSSTGAIVVREVGYQHNDLSRNIRIEGNRIYNSGNAGIIAAGVSGLTVIGNHIDGYGLKESSPHRDRKMIGDNYAIVLHASTDVEMRDNHAQTPGAFAKGFVFPESELRMSSGAKEKRVTAHWMTALPPRLAKPDRPLDSWRHHFEVAASYGVNDLTIYMEPGAWDQLDNILESAEIAAKIPNFTISICIGPGRSSLMRDWLPVVKKWCAAVREKPGITKVDGRPVIWTYHAAAASLDEWKAFTEALREADLDAYLIADLFAFSFKDKAGFLATVEEWAQVLDSVYFFGPEIRDERYDALIAAGDRKIATVGGGYWRWARDSQGRTQLYEGTRKLENSWRSALEKDPDWIHLTTWNDYLEHTMFEPTRNRADLYGEMSLAMIAEWKGEERVAAPGFWLVAPAEVRNGPGGLSEYIYEVYGQDIESDEAWQVELRFINDRGEVVRVEKGQLNASNQRVSIEWEPKAGEFGTSHYLMISAHVSHHGSPELTATLPLLIWPEHEDRVLYKAPRMIRLREADEIPPAPKIHLDEEGQIVVESMPALGDPNLRYDILYNMHIKGTEGVSAGEAEIGPNQLLVGGVLEPYYFSRGFRQAATITSDGRVSWAEPIWVEEDFAYDSSASSAFTKYLGWTPDRIETPIRINFQEGKSPVDGYQIDSGLPFGDRGNGYFYGWSRDVQNFARKRHTNPSPLLRTHIPTGYRMSRWEWEIALPNGEYEVELSVGDAAHASNKEVVIEGEFMSGGARQVNTFQHHQKTVVIEDSRLTLSSAEAPASLNYIVIDRVEPSKSNEK